MKPEPIPAAELAAGDFLGSLKPSDLVYFLCNVGDADAQVLLAPERTKPDGASDGVWTRRALVIDAGRKHKVPQLLRDLAANEFFEEGRTTIERGDIALVVATHPHLDHISGVPQLFEEFGDAIAEYWDSGYYHTLPSYMETMAAVEERGDLLYCQPTSGMRRWIGEIQVTVLAPSIGLRNRYDSYGIEINNASLTLRVDFPASRVVQRDDRRNLIDKHKKRTLILGADAQTLSWSYVFTDFPYLEASDSAAAKALNAATGDDPLAADILKVSHHGSKHGVNLELVERIGPWLTLISSVAYGGSYGFPHTVAQELIREALEPTTRDGKDHQADHKLRVFYTCDTAKPTDAPLGTFAVVIGRNGSRAVWRFGDEPGDHVNLLQGRRLKNLR